MGKKIITFFLAIMAFMACYPVIFLVVGSFMSKGELQVNLAAAMGGGDKEYVKWSLFPLYPTLRFYVELLVDTPKFFVMFWNSVKIALGVLAGQLLIGVPAAWGFAKQKFPFKRVLFMIYIALMMMPFQVSMLSNYLVLDGLKLLDTTGAIVLPAIFSTFPVFIMYHFFNNIPEAIIESAKLDGASNLQVFFRIAIPLGSPGIISAMVLGFLEYWNLIEQPLTFLKDKTLWPLSLFLPTIELDKAGVALVSSVLTLIPSILVFFAGQDYLEQGIMATAVKE